MSARGWGSWEKMGMIANGYGASFWGDKNVLKLIMVMVTQFYE